MYFTVVYRTYHRYNKYDKIYILEGDIDMAEFNPSKTEKSVITVRIETELLNEIDELSGKIDISRNELIMQCIRFAMNNYPKIKKGK